MAEMKYIHDDPNSFSKLMSSKGNLEELLAEELGPEFHAYRERWEAAARFEERPEFPIHIDIEGNASCNLKCPMCTWSAEVVVPGKASWMDFGLYKDIIDQSVPQGLCAVGFDWVNEPLIRRDMAEFVAYARDAGVLDRITHTNGTLLTRKMSEQLIDAGLTRMMVSLDAFTEETYNKIRIGSNMPKVLKNIHEFLAVRAEKSSKLPLFSVNFVRMSTNEHELESFINYWAEYVDFFAVQNYTNPFEDRTESDNTYFAESRELISKFRCQQPWQRLTIRFDGTVMPCCSFYAEDLVIGDVRKQTIKEIWDSPQMRELQDLHADARYFDNPICKACALNTTAIPEERF